MRQLRILLIDGGQTLVSEAVSVLLQAGYQVETASDPLEGLKKLYEALPDLIIITKEVPPVNGEDSFLRVRQASYLPILVVGGEEEAAETLESGADAYINAPPNPTLLVARVRSLLQRKSKYYPPGSDTGSGGGQSTMKKPDNGDGYCLTEVTEDGTNQ